MPNLFTIIGTTWSFYRKHPVLNSITFWLLFVPPSIIEAISNIADIAFAQEASPTLPLHVDTGIEIALGVLVTLFLIYFMLWGQACIIMVGKRLFSSPAGRNRTSFSAVRKETRGLIFPLFFTELLRTIFTLLWAILFIFPGIVYAVRTAFFDIILVTEKLYGRDALNASKEIVQGRTWKVFWYFLGLGLIFMVPVSLLDAFVEDALNTFDIRWVPFASIVMNALTSFSYMLFLLCAINLFAEVKKLPQEVMPAPSSPPSPLS